ncbi:MarR family winged helix-turn-helix transcriptional regulator [Aeromicrobium sp. CF4.19]|uniref:MarR family winged helix-turn-helix transcriptional regulator n=1 Tax=Aeromicrobium sp. CF4.19 TaxID=3373082 RepID=UPI003EE68D5D
MSATRDDLYGTLEEFLERVLSFCQTDAMDQLVDLDVSFSQARMLFVLAPASEPLAINEIASRLGLSVAAAGRNVDSLVRLGVLERHESPDDRRVKLVALTERGFDIVDAQFAQRKAALRTFAERVPQTEAQDLVAALRPILAGDYLRESTKDTP